MQHFTEETKALTQTRNKDIMLHHVSTVCQDLMGTGVGQGMSVTKLLSGTTRSSKVPLNCNAKCQPTSYPCLTPHQLLAASLRLTSVDSCAHLLLHGCMHPGASHGGTLQQWAALLPSTTSGTRWWAVTCGGASAAGSAGSSPPPSPGRLTLTFITFSQRGGGGCWG